jgi:hypothetical protein
MGSRMNTVDIRATVLLYGNKKPILHNIIPYTCKRFLGRMPRTQVAVNVSTEQQRGFTGTIGFNRKAMVLVRDFNLPSFH